MFVKVCLGYDKGVPTPAHGAQRPVFGQLYSDWHKQREVVDLWPLDFHMNTKASTRVKPRRLWRPEPAWVLHSEFAISGVERAEIAGRRVWVVQRWMITPMSFAQAQEEENQVKAERWRWV